MLDAVIAKKEVTLHILRTFGIQMSKKLGQNFLISEQTVNDIVRVADIGPNDTVLEIGPGIGTLTQALAKTGCRVLAVEIDARLVKVLHKTLEYYDNVRILHNDIMKVDISREIGAPSCKVVANLPYYITTPIIMKLLEDKLPITTLVTMVQKEVAERMTARPGGKEYGALSVAVQYYTQPKIEFIVGPQNFIPPPAVDSAVIRCDVRSEPAVTPIDEKVFFRVVKAAFAQRRKTLTNSLQGTGVSKKQVLQILSNTGIDGQRRGETLSLEEFKVLADSLVELQKGIN